MRAFAIFFCVGVGDFFFPALGAAVVVAYAGLVVFAGHDRTSSFRISLCPCLLKACVQWGLVDDIIGKITLLVVVPQCPGLPNQLI